MVIAHIITSCQDVLVIELKVSCLPINTCSPGVSGTSALIPCCPAKFYFVQWDSLLLVYQQGRGSASQNAKVVASAKSKEPRSSTRCGFW